MPDELKPLASLPGMPQKEVGPKNYKVARSPYLLSMRADRPEGSPHPAGDISFFSRHKTRELAEKRRDQEYTRLKGEGKVNVRHQIQPGDTEFSSLDK